MNDLSSKLKYFLIFNLFLPLTWTFSANDLESPYLQHKNLSITHRRKTRLNHQKKKRRLSIKYMSFFNGPAIFNDDLSLSPNSIGKPSDDGLRFNNNISFRHRLKKDFYLDFQARFHWITNNSTGAEDFKPLRWQSPRVGISTTFFKTENGKLTGAFNTDLPYFFPEPLGGGYIAAERTTLLTPGFFAKYSWAPKNSRWSLFSLVQPRLYLYENRNVAEPQYSRSGYSPRLKNELTLSFSPSINYAFSDQLGFRFGTQLIYKKLVASGWNPFYGTNRTADPNSKAWRLSALPLQTGLTYEFSKLLKISGFLQAYPLSMQRIDKSGRKASFKETFSAGAWVSGQVF